MSWLFGYKKPETQFPPPDPNQQNNPGSQNTAGQASNDPQLTKAERKAMEAYRFDSSALERAAEAAKTLEKSSKNFEIIMQSICNTEILPNFRECKGSSRIVKVAGGDKATRIYGESEGVRSSHRRFKSRAETSRS